MATAVDSTPQVGVFSIKNRDEERTEIYGNLCYAVFSPDKHKLSQFFQENFHSLCTFCTSDNSDIFHILTWEIFFKNELEDKYEIFRNLLQVTDQYGCTPPILRIITVAEAIQKKQFKAVSQHVEIISKNWYQRMQIIELKLEKFSKRGDVFEQLSRLRFTSLTGLRLVWASDVIKIIKSKSLPGYKHILIEVKENAFAQCSNDQYNISRYFNSLEKTLRKAIFPTPAEAREMKLESLYLC